MATSAAHRNRKQRGKPAAAYLRHPDHAACHLSVPHQLRTKADSVQKIVGYADTGVMLVAISVMVPNVERPDYLPLFLLQAAFVLVSAVVYDLLVKEPALVQKMRQKSLEMGIREDEVEKDDPPEAGGKEHEAE